MGGWQGDWRVRGEQEMEGRHLGQEAAMAQDPSWSVRWAPGGAQGLGPGLTVLKGEQTGHAEGAWWALSSAHSETTQCLQRDPPPNRSLQGEGSEAARSLLPRSRHFPGGFCSPVAGLGTCGNSTDPCLCRLSSPQRQQALEQEQEELFPQDCPTFDSLDLEKEDVPLTPEHR